MAEIDARPPKTRLQAHLLIKGFLARGPSDPYTRFIPPEEFKQLTKFDVSGAGANVVTAEEYQQKVVKALPRSKTAADGGVWVVGLIKVCCSSASIVITLLSDSTNHDCCYNFLGFPERENVIPILAAHATKESTYIWLPTMNSCW